MPPFSIVAGAEAIKGVHVPHAEWVVFFYPVVLEVLQELILIVKCWSFTLQPLQATLTNVGGTNVKEIKEFLESQTLHLPPDSL